jgi:hypothetical protein
VHHNNLLNVLVQIAKKWDYILKKNHSIRLDKSMSYWFQILVQDTLKVFSRITKDVTLNKILDILGFQIGTFLILYLMTLSVYPGV